MARPLVSIVLPTFNRLDCLRETVDSVFHQTIQNWELIVADDGSEADTIEYLSELQDGERVRVLRLDHCGNPARVRNAAIAAVRAPYIAFLDSDDLWRPDKLDRQLAALRAAKRCRWSYTAFTIVDDDGAPLATEKNRKWVPHSGFIFPQVVRGAASIRTPAVLACTRLVHEVGAFDEAADCSEDYDLWMRFALVSAACLVGEPLVLVRRHTDNRKMEFSAPYIARDYSLRKLAQQLDGAQRVLVKQERSENSLALAVETASRQSRRRALAVIGKGLAFSWKYPRWWYRAAKTILRVCFQ
jgi:glycosyltransferase involved in cell wall biosynthesis